MQVVMNGKSIWLNWHHLYYFYVVVNEGSLAKASKILLLGQPTLSSQIKNLESTLGVNLFDRDSKRLVLSDAGKIAHEYATKIFMIGNEMIANLSMPEQVKEVIRIGASESVPKNVVLKVLKKAVNDSLTVSIIKGNTTELTKDLIHNKLDYIITNNNAVMSGGNISSKLILSSSVVICGSKKFKNLSEDFPRSLQGKSFILPLTSSKLRKELDSFFKKQGVAISIIGEMKDVSMQKSMAIEGMGLVALPSNAAEELIDSNQICEIGRLPDLTEEYYLLSKGDSHLSLVS